MSQPLYLVIPFHRDGLRIGPGQPLVCQAAAQAKALAKHLAPRVPGIAILERSVDPETGDPADRLIADIGAIPESFPERADWSMRLN